MMNDLWNELEPTSEGSNNLWDELDSDGFTEPDMSLYDNIDVGGSSVVPSDEATFEDIESTTSQDSTSTMTLPEVEQSAKQQQENIDYPKQILAGARQSVTLPAAKVVEDVLSNIGIDVGHQSSKDLATMNKMIKDYNDKHQDQMIHPATLGNIVSQLAVPMSKGMTGIAATEAILNTLDGIGKTEGYEHIYKDAAVGAAFGVGSQLLFNRLTRSLGPLSYEAKVLIKEHPELEEDTILEALKDVPKRDQALALSNMVEDYAPITTASIKTNNDRLLLKSMMKQRNSQVRNFVGDTEEQVANAKKYYTDMVNEVATSYPQKQNFESMISDLDSLVKRYDKTPSKALSIANGLKADLESGSGMMDIRTALQFRKDLNYLINRATRYEETNLLNKIKSNVDGFIESNVDKQTMEVIDDAISNYRRAMNNKDFIELMDKHTKRDIVDWVGFSKSLKREHLSSPEVDGAIDIVKEFSEKFKNDAALRGATVLKGQRVQGPGIMFVYSYMLSKTIDALRFYGSRYGELKVQKAILKSIRNAKSPLDAIEKMSYNGVPPKTVKDIQRALIVDYDPQRLLDWKPNAKLSAKESDLYPYYATSKGTVGRGKDISNIALHDSTKEVLSSMLNDLDSKQVMTKLNDIGFFSKDFKRFDDIVKTTRKQLKAADLEHNIKVVKNIITNEAKQLVRAIEKDHGLKLPKSEAEKIVKMKLDDMMKGCK